MNHEENIRRFEELFAGIKRSGAERVLNYIKQSDFYTAPASTNKKYPLALALHHADMVATYIMEKEG